LHGAGIRANLPRLFRFTLIDAENGGSLGVVAFARTEGGDVIPQAPGQKLRVVQVWPAERDDQLLVLVVRVAE
jgi:hypothetical protein